MNAQIRKKLLSGGNREMNIKERPKVILVMNPELEKIVQRKNKNLHSSNRSVLVAKNNPLILHHEKTEA